MIDTTILIDYFRKKDKEKSRLVQHFKEYPEIFISSITEFEVYNGAKEAHREFWDRLLSRISVIDFDSRAAREAASIVAELKSKRRSIDKPDLFIAATAVIHGLRFDTFNRKHFEGLKNLRLLDKGE